MKKESLVSMKDLEVPPSQPNFKQSYVIGNKNSMKRVESN